jgi:4-alpha-glucanotransferase
MRRDDVDVPRSSGVLLHVTSLPGRGVGEIGAPAHAWVEWLADAGQTLWQILPLVPVGEGGSPYNGLSALAGNPLLVSLEPLVDEGLLDRVPAAPFPADHVDYPSVIRWKDELLRAASHAFRAGAAPHLRGPFTEFRRAHAGWIEDYALFRAVREEMDGAAWIEWDRPIRLREARAVDAWRGRLGDRIDDHVFRQFLFDRQWALLRRHANQQGIRLVGDIPIFVAYDSADVWANRELFLLDEEGRPTHVAGVPPDYFSETGQRWGNPLYRWDEMARRGYPWWKQRFRRALEQVDIARVDHFRGFEAFWEIPAAEQTAMVGQWVEGPGAALFRSVEEELGPLPLIAEDLGLITPGVEALRDELGLPGMRVLQFAFDGDPSNPHLPRNYPEHCVCYTGTHDNDTTLGWWQGADAEQRALVRRQAPDGSGGIHWDFIQLAFDSPARWAVVPLQDVLGLGNEARMNTPGIAGGNWSWRVRAEEITGQAQARLRDVTRDTDRRRVDHEDRHTARRGTV